MSWTNVSGAANISLIMTLAGGLDDRLLVLDVT